MGYDRKTLYARKSLSFAHKTRIKPVPLQMRPARSANSATCCGGKWRILSGLWRVLPQYSAGMDWRDVAENGGLCRDYGGFCRSIARVQVGGMWRIMADFVGIVAEYVKRISLYLPLPATHFLTVFLSVLCDLCGKKSLPRFMAQCGGKWRKMADFVGIVAEYVKRISLYLPLPATHFLTVFLSVLCDLCGKKSLPRFMTSEYPLFYHSQNEPNFAMFFLRGYTLSLSFINNWQERKFA